MEKVEEKSRLWVVLSVLLKVVGFLGNLLLDIAKPEE